MSIYLDHAASTPMDDSVIAAMTPYYKDVFYNPSAIYLAGRDVKQRLTAYRSRVAHWLGARPDEIIFTAGATESDNLAVHGVMQRYPQAQIAVSAVEHDAVLEAAKLYDYRVIPVDKNGRVTAEALTSTITDNCVLVSVMYANNEIGSIQPISEIMRIIDDMRQRRIDRGIALPLYVHCDATQAANYLDLHVNRLKIDLMTLNASKIYGPKQVGVLYVRGGTEIAPTVRGGGQERGLRSGTENVAGAAGMAAALDLVQSSRHEEARRLESICMKSEKTLKSEIPDMVILGGKKRLPNNLAIMLPGLDGERAVMELDEAGIQCSTGSACAALSDEASHVIKALGYSDAEASSTLRLTMGRSTSDDDMLRAIEKIVELYSRKRHL